MPHLWIQLHQWIFEPSLSSRRRSHLFWLSLSLTFSVIYSILALKQAFSTPFVVQDDARQHVFWMQRWLDSSLFPDDLIANYFQSVAPQGYTFLYHLGAALGLNPMVFNKILPLVLGIITTLYCYGLALELLPLPVVGFTASLLLNQTLNMNDDVVSATPRAFVYVLFLAFLYYLSRRSLFPCLITIALQGLFYPQSIFLSAGLCVLSLVQWQGIRPKLSRNWKDYRFVGAGLAVAVGVMLPFALTSSEFAPIITVAEAQALPEFYPGGRSSFFGNDFWRFWISGERSGFFPYGERMPTLNWMVFALPILWGFQSRFPLAQRTQRSLRLLPEIMGVSLFWFFTAHAVLFHLHLPSRYTQHSLRIVVCLASAIALAILWDWLWRQAMLSNRRSGQAMTQSDLPRFRRWWAIGVMSVTSLWLIVAPSFVHPFPRGNYVVGEQPDLYEFLAQQPVESLIASISLEADLIPSFSQRSVLVGREYGIPYHMGYYTQFQRRTSDLVQAQYTPDLREVRSFIQDYGVDLWLLDQGFDTLEYLQESWVEQFPGVTREAKRSLRRGVSPALASIPARCTVFQNSAVMVLEASCVVEASNSGG